MEMMTAIYGRVYRLTFFNEKGFGIEGVDGYRISGSFVFFVVGFVGSWK